MKVRGLFVCGAELASLYKKPPYSTYVKDIVDSNIAHIYENLKHEAKTGKAWIWKTKADSYSEYNIELLVKEHQWLTALRDYIATDIDLEVIVEPNEVIVFFNWTKA